ncbi:GNAT family N-acetyltransferase [Cellulomonas bogoriensis]|nr:N-acetyltransferase [Cellulomonas bogoriensis]
MVALRRSGRVVLLGRGDPTRTVQHLTALLGSGPPWVGEVGWMSLPRPARVPTGLLGAVGLEPFSTWDWLALDREPHPVPGEEQVRELGPCDTDAIRDCLDVANPRSGAEATVTGTTRWWGVDGPEGGLLGVVQAALHAGDPTGSGRSWHLRGLAVDPQHRGKRWGAALTAAATRWSLRGGADWVSLGMYADNDPARRVYESLGFTVEAAFASFGPAGAQRPPS